jgi:hypothetical protein
METIQIGKIYRHFKGGIYQVLCTATHTESNEKLVIYQALYGKFQVFARPMSQFTEEVPDSDENVTKQRYRFEEIKDLEDEAFSKCNIKEVRISVENEKVAVEPDPAEDTVENTGEAPSPVIMQFLDAGSSKEKLDIIKANYNKIDERTITNMEVSLDIISSSENLDQRIGYVCDVLSTRSRFEDSRLR